jgi:hypothetical protein
VLQKNRNRADEGNKMSFSLRVRRRIERLEAGAFSPRSSGIRAVVIGAALARLSTPDLMQLIEASEGKLAYEEWSAAQMAAGEALRTGMEEECLLAGFNSVAEFSRGYPERAATA